MATIAQLNIRLGLLSRQFDSDLRRFERRMQATAANLGSIGEKLTLSITAPLAAISIGAIKTAAEFESLRLAMQTTFESVGRGAEEANAEIEALRKAALAPGLDFEQAVKGSVRLQGVGISAEKARVILSELGNALASSGGSADQLDAVTKQFTQIIGKGRLLQEDLSIILENMPALASVLREEFGTTSAEAIRALGVSAEDFIDRITNRMQTLPRVAGGLTNSIVNAGVAIRTAAANIGEELNKAFNISGRLNAFADWITDLADRFSKLDEGTKRLILGVGVFVAALGPAIKVTSLMISASVSLYGTFARVAESFRITGAAATGTLGIFSRLNTAMKLSVFGVAAGVVLALAAAFVTLNNDTDEAAYSQQVFAEAQKRVTEEVGKETAILNKNFDVLKNAASTSEERTAAINELQATYPDYLRNINLEGASLAQLSEIQGQLNSQILRSVAERQKAIAVEAEYNKVAQAQLRINQLRQNGFDALTGDEVKRSGRSLFGTDFEKGFVSAGARAEVVRDVIKALEGDIQQSTKAVGDLSTQFDKTFGIGTVGANKQTDALTRQREAVMAAEDALEDMTPAQRAALSFGDQWDKQWKQIQDGTKKTEGSFDAYQKAVASIQAVVDKGNVLGADVFQEQAKEIENQIERLLENGFKPYSREIQNLRGMLAKMKSEQQVGFFNVNETQAALVELQKIDNIIAGITSKAPISLVQIQPGSGTALNLPEIPTIKIPLSVEQLEPAKRGIEEIRDLQAAAIDFIRKKRLQAADEAIKLQEQEADGRRAVLDQAFSSVQSVFSNIQSLQQGYAQESISRLEAEYASRIEAAKGNAGVQDRLNKELATKREKIERESARKSKAIALFSAIINVAQGVTKALGSVAPPFNFQLAALVAAAGAVQVGTIAATPLAEGGVITSPTYALIGEYPGAATNPEIVAPESKLRKIFNESGGDSGVLTTVLRGDDIQIVLDRAATRRGRTR